MTAALPLHAQEKPRMRRHGCERPWAFAQIIAAGIVALSVAIFYAFSVHELPSDLHRIVLVMVSVQLAMVVLLFLTISFLDPAHPAVIERHHRNRSVSMTNATQSPDDSMRDLESGHHSPLHQRCSGDCTGATDCNSHAPTQSTSPQVSVSTAPSISSRPRILCALCDVAVSVGTRHCSVCRKCIAGFDHHCVYLNTCIGTRNYPLFISLLTCTILLVATQLAIAIYAIDRVRRRGDTTRAVVVSILCLLPLLQLFSMLVLAFFHSYLFCKGLKTYEWLRRFHEGASRFTAKTPTWDDQHDRRDSDEYNNSGGMETRRALTHSESGDHRKQPPTNHGANTPVAITVDRPPRHHASESHAACSPPQH